MKKEIKIKNVLASLYDFSQQVREKSRGLEKEMEKVRVLIQRAFEIDLLSIFQYDYLTRRLVPLYRYGDPYNLVDAVNFRLGKGATAWCVQHKKALLITNLKRSGVGNRFFVNSFLAVPIIINDLFVGAITMGGFHKDQYTEGDRFLLEIIAPFLGGIILKNEFAIKKEAAEITVKE